MPDIDEINDADVFLAGVIPMQTTGVLLERSFPGHGHGQHQGVQWRMVESFADQFPSGQKNTGRIGRQCVEFGNQRISLLPGHSPMEHKRSRDFAVQG